MGARTPASHTTRPSVKATGEASSADRAAIRWVHPKLGFSFLHDGHVLGREPSCDTVLGGEEVSRRHAEVRLRGPVPLLVDLDSRNGMYLNGVRQHQHLFGPGDVVRIGEWVGVMVELAPDHATRFELVEHCPGWYGGAALTAVTEAVRRVAKTNLPVVVQGETGTGKEGIAKALHAWSERRGAFIAVDCGALAEQLAEGALFGYRKGAFTGADRSHQGYFQAADGGTLFLDEILNLSAALQSKLLRVLERGEVLSLGHSHPTRVDVRVVCAAQDSLYRAVKAGRFRADLLGRLDGLTLVLPPMRERRDEIVPLFRRLMADCAGERENAMDAMDARFAEALLLYDWPLNVRELVRLVQRLIALHAGEPQLRRSMLPSRMLSSGTRPPSPAGRARTPADDPDEFEALLSALRENEGNLSKAAVAVGVTRARAYRLIQARPDVDLGPLRKSSEKP